MSDGAASLLAAAPAAPTAGAGAGDPPAPGTDLNQRGVRQHRLGHLPEALACFRHTLSVDPTDVEALINQGNVLRDLHRPADALASFDRAHALDPGLVAVFINRGNALRDLGRPSEALADYDRALAIDAANADLHSNRAAVLNDLHRPDDALESCERAIALRPDHAEAYSNLGILLGELGRFADAHAALEKAVTLAPGQTRFHYNLAMAKRYTPDDAQLAAMQTLARRTLTAEQRMWLHFALGKALADIDDPEGSFSHYAAGNALKRPQVQYDEAAVLASLGRVREVFTPGLMCGGARGAASFCPVFVIGMPRSGSTLVEQILASHPSVFGAGEIDDFARAVAACGGPGQAIALDSNEHLRALGESYLARIQGQSPDVLRIVNKMTDNFRVAGMIHLALPNARMIHVMRDPLDTCVSCFTHLFQRLPFAYDLGELGRYYRAYQATMAHWRNVLPPGVMLEVQYESLVADLEGHARRIVAHCGLQWSGRCMAFHQTERHVRTASSYQVRQPLYGHSIGKWRGLERFLAPLLQELDQGHSEPATANRG